MELFTVSFTTKTKVKKFGPKGKIISETELSSPMVLTALPHATAMSYAGCDNFKITNYVPAERRTSKCSGRDNSVGNGTKKVSLQRTESGAKSGDLKTYASGAKTGQSQLAHAASTGNMAAALNA